MWNWEILCAFFAFSNSTATSILILFSLHRTLESLYMGTCRWITDHVLQVIADLLTYPLFMSACVPLSSPLFGVIWLTCFANWMNVKRYLDNPKIIVSLLSAKVEYHFIFQHLSFKLLLLWVTCDCHGIPSRFLADLEVFFIFSGYSRVVDIFF